MEPVYLFIYIHFIYLFFDAVFCRWSETDREIEWKSECFELQQLLGLSVHSVKYDRVQVRTHLFRYIYLFIFTSLQYVFVFVLLLV